MPQLKLHRVQLLLLQPSLNCADVVDCILMVFPLVCFITPGDNNVMVRPKRLGLHNDDPSIDCERTEWELKIQNAIVCPEDPFESLRFGQQRHKKPRGPMRQNENKHERVILSKLKANPQHFGG